MLKRRGIQIISYMIHGLSGQYWWKLYGWTRWSERSLLTLTILWLQCVLKFALHVLSVSAASATARSPWSPYMPRKISTQHDSLYSVLNFHLLSSRRTRVNWFLAFPSCSWAVYTPLSSSQKFWIISSTRPFSLMKFILCVCIKQSKYNKFNGFQN